MTRLIVLEKSQEVDEPVVEKAAVEKAAVEKAAVEEPVAKSLEEQAKTDITLSHLFTYVIAYAV